MRKKMTSGCGLALIPVLVIAGLTCQRPQKSAQELVAGVVEAVGGRDALYALQDVEYEYAYVGEDGKRDVSLERYVFDGEKSWARYLVRKKFALPTMTGELVQGYDGKESWMTLRNELVTDPQAMKLADFSRKTNYYWLTMMFKLLDPGLTYESLGRKTVDHTDYDLVKVTFGEKVGDAQDTYVLYINPKTHLVDQFLFTVMDFNKSEPFLMRVQYEEAGGLKWPARRRYTKSDWDGNVLGEAWAQEICTGLKFHNGFKPELFEKPVAQMSEAQ